MTDAEQFERDFSVSRETMDRLETYRALLVKWNRTINLVSPSTVDEIWTRHFYDSAQLLTYVPETAEKWVDFGSGGGFPALVVAILAAEKHPNLRVFCIESDLRKATFLKTVARDTGLDVGVFSRRIEDVPEMAVDVVSARALASLERLLPLAVRHLKEDGIALFLKGENAAQEIADAKANWAFRLETFESKTNRDAKILRIGEISGV